jgi:heme oxygenase
MELGPHVGWPTPAAESEAAVAAAKPSLADSLSDSRFATQQRVAMPLPAVPLEELHRADGVGSGEKILVSLLGIVFDCSTVSGREFFGPSGPYSAFAGHDASYSLSYMSLKPEDVDRFDFAADEDNLQTLAEWIAYFDTAYERVGWLTGCPRHTLALSELPPVSEKKLGETSYGGGDERDQHVANTLAQREYDAVFEGAGGPAELASSDPPSEAEDDDDDDDGRLSMHLFNSCMVLHTSIMRTDLMGQCIEGTVTRPLYTRYLANLFAVYSELEPQLEAHASSRYVAAMHDTRLERLPSLREDLRFFLGQDWGEALPPQVPAAVQYAQRIREVASQPHRLAVHHWLRYGAGMAGGQFLRNTLSRVLGLAASADGRTTPGIRYNEFDELDLADDAFYREYLAGMDQAGASASETERAEMVAEAKLTFELNIRMNDEIVEAELGERQARRDRVLRYISESKSAKTGGAKL